MEGKELKERFQLKCRECGKEFPPEKLYVCDECFGPLDVIYDYNVIVFNRDSLKDRPYTIWRYHELLPIKDFSKVVDLSTGYTTLHECNNLADILGLKKVYVKDDTGNPTNSFKDRPASVAVTKAREFGAKIVGCASTGNLAAATAAHAAKAGLTCYILVPEGIEKSKIVQASTYGAKIISVRGTYDDANRIAAQSAELYNWAFVNINLRPYYVEGSKTIAFEVCEQLGWELPDHIVVPVASGALLCAVNKGFKELYNLGLIERKDVRISAAQPKGCSPVVSAFKSGAYVVKPVEQPDTLAKSLAIGEPGDGIYAIESVRESHGTAEFASDEEIVEAIKLLAKKEGVFSEPAGAVTIAVLKKLVESGEVSADESVVCLVTGNGLKTTEAIIDSLENNVKVEASLSSLESLVEEGVL